ncbi:MAG: hypothetical protein H0T44_05925 [Gemmatimonadales bacterium]|nr:hypothetical protein [Gemmatimonadales bacterium]MDQ3427430.1 hypothetical protein [Gemmatimonadota bacterium]
MNQERAPVRGPELGRWLLIAALILIGIALYFRFSQESGPPAPVTEELGQ